MSTTATFPPDVRVTLPGTYDRVFYGSMAVSMALLVLIGFGPTYYFRSYFGTPPTVSGSTELTAMTRLHGAVFSAWVVLFLIQTTLVARRHVAWHRKLGLAGMVLAAAMVIIGTTTAIAGAARGSAPPGADPLAFLAVPLFDMVLFAGFVVAAFSQRRNKEAHKRLMLLAYISIITAAVARLPGVLPFGPLVFFGLSYLYVIGGAVYDRATRGRVHPVYIWGGAVLLASVVVRLALSGTEAWRAFAGWLVTL